MKRNYTRLTGWRAGAAIQHSWMLVYQLRFDRRGLRFLSLCGIYLPQSSNESDMLLAARCLGVSGHRISSPLNESSI